MLFLGISLLDFAILKSSSRCSKKLPGMAWQRKKIVGKRLRKNGIYDVKLTSINGFLSGHYKPANKILNPAPDVHNRANISVPGAHKCDHV